MKSETNENAKSLPANIIVAGITGTGKSTLIEAVFGENAAVTTIPERKSNNVEQSVDKYKPVHVWDDTCGFELSHDGKILENTIDEIRSLIAERNKSNHPEDHIHVIWYCIDSCSHHFFPGESEFVSSIAKLGVPLLLVMTQSYDEESDVDFQECIKKVLSEYGVKNISVVQVLAKEKVFKHPLTKENIVLPPKGLDTLVQLTLDKMPECAKDSFVAAQRVMK